MATFDYRRELTRPETLQALAVGVGAGLAAGVAVSYLARVLRQRTPVTREAALPPPVEELLPARRARR